MFGMVVHIVPRQISRWLSPSADGGGGGGGGSCPKGLAWSTIEIELYERQGTEFDMANLHLLFFTSRANFSTGLARNLLDSTAKARPCAFSPSPSLCIYKLIPCSSS